MNRRGILAGLVGAAVAVPAFAKTKAKSEAKASAKSSGKSPTMLVEAFAATLSAHDMDAFAALFGDDYVNHQVSAAAPPPPAGTSAKQGSVGFFASRLKGIPDLKVSIEVVVADGDKVAASFVYQGTQTGTLLGVAPTGKPMRFTSCDVFRVADGKFVEHWGMGDIAGQLAQMKS